MCRVLAYLGEPIALEDVLFRTDSALASQAYSPRMMASFLNLAGFGMAAWDGHSRLPDEPFTYRVTTLPVFDRNLKSLAHKLSPTCLIAHVRGVTYSGNEVISDQNLHPFRYDGTRLSLAHNGHLREFARMRNDLLEFVSPEFARRIQGTTDSEWLYALILSQLDDPGGRPSPAELVDATIRAFSIVRRVRERHEIRTSSPANLFISDGAFLLATRFSFDYGWYPEDDALLETDLPYVSLWYTLGDAYLERDGEWMMTESRGSPRSLIVASEPLTSDVSTWIEAPEYSILTAWQADDGLQMETIELTV